MTGEHVSELKVLLVSLTHKVDAQAEMLLSLTEARVKEWYSVEELAKILKRTPFTCREYCRLGRLRAKKRKSGRGAHPSWVVSHEELLRYEREGLLPLAEPEWTD